MAAISNGVDVESRPPVASMPADVTLEAYANLQLDYDEKCNDVAELRAELAAKRMEAQQMRIRLRAAGVKNTENVKAEVSVTDTSGSRGADTCRMLQWLAEHVELACPLCFDACCEVNVAGRCVQFRHVAQWRLKTPQGNLKVSVPAELEYAIGNLLAAIKARGNLIDEAMAKPFTDVWDFVATEAAPMVGAPAEPALILAHKETSAGIIVATWPKAEVKRYLLEDVFHDGDDGVHFRLSMDMEDRAEADWFVRWGSTVDGIPVEKQGRGWVKVGKCFLPVEIEGMTVLREVEADPSDVHGFGVPRSEHRLAAVPCHVAVGDRVEVAYGGQWFTGVLHAVEGGYGSVQCDADPRGVRTMASLAAMKKLQEGGKRPPGHPGRAGHVRAKSAT